MLKYMVTLIGDNTGQWIQTFVHDGDLESARAAATTDGVRYGWALLDIKRVSK